jgi:hypothetical protein
MRTKTLNTSAAKEKITGKMFQQTRKKPMALIVADGPRNSKTKGIEDRRFTYLDISLCRPQ